MLNKDLSTYARLSIRHMHSVIRFAGGTAGIRASGASGPQHKPPVASVANLQRVAVPSHRYCP